jgi:hypothetical protein
MTHLIGRAATARHIRDLVTADRVVTLTGPGGQRSAIPPKMDRVGWIRLEEQLAATVITNMIPLDLHGATTLPHQVVSVDSA